MVGLGLKNRGLLLWNKPMKITLKQPVLGIVPKSRLIAPKGIGIAPITYMWKFASGKSR
jgi:hypothetical protein